MKPVEPLMWLGIITLALLCIAVAIVVVVGIFTLVFALMGNLHDNIKKDGKDGRK